jgi:hypothetical protein
MAILNPCPKCGRVNVRLVPGHLRECTVIAPAVPVTAISEPAGANVPAALNPAVERLPATVPRVDASSSNRRSSNNASPNRSTNARSSNASTNKPTSATARWRARHADHYRDYMREYMRRYRRQRAAPRSLSR